MRPLIAVVQRTARRLLRRVPPSSGILYEDLNSAGMLALVEAGGRFDAGRGVEFGLYAYRRIHGAMIDELRQLDTVSRERRHAIRAGTDNSTTPRPRLVEITAADSVADPALDAESFAVRAQSLRHVRVALDRLPPRLQKVLQMRLELDWTLREIADHLGVTQGRACQLVTEGVHRVRKSLEPSLFDAAA